MVIPEDWDKPDKDNAKLCEKFSYEELSADGLSLRYRLFVPDTSENIPLVLYLHGADAIGNDNEMPLLLHDIGTMFVRDDWQERHPCAVLAPQYGHGEYWTNPSVEKAVLYVIDSLCKNHPIDKNRIYVYGYSAGGVGTLFFMAEHPDIFAAALAVCGATRERYLSVLSKKPLWLIHAEDDAIVKASYREGAKDLPTHLGSRDIYDAIGDSAPLLRYTEYQAGYMLNTYGVNPHCSWVCVSDEKNTEFAEWLFEKKLG